MDYRLKKQKDFSLVFKKGKRLFCNEMTVLYVPSNEIKFGITVGKKHGGSVIRNRIKRLYRESFRSFVPFFDANFFFVFIPKVNIERTYEDVRKNMQYIFSKSGLIKKN